MREKMYEGDMEERFNELPIDRQKEIRSIIQGMVIPRVTINKKHSSYGMKHIFQKWCGYMTNGEFTGAMLSMGYRPHDINAQNWHFRISEKSPCFERRFE